MTPVRLALLVPVLFLLHTVQGQKKPESLVSSSFKGTLVLPAPLNNPLFNSVTETLGQLDGVVQFPLANGFGIGAGAKMTWFGVKERALAPDLTSGDIRRATFFGKAQYETYTGDRTFFEFSTKMGSSTYVFDCPKCSDESTRTVFHWAVGVGYYLHATDNLAFGLTLGYERDNTRFSSDDLGLPNFPGRQEKVEDRNFQNFLIGLGFSTRLRKSDDGPGGW